MRAAIHYALAVGLLTIYGGEVCPFLEGLGTAHVGVILAAAFALAWLARGPLQRRFVEASLCERRAEAGADE